MIRLLLIVAALVVGCIDTEEMDVTVFQHWLIILGFLLVAALWSDD